MRYGRMSARIGDVLVRAVEDVELVAVLHEHLAPALGLCWARGDTTRLWQSVCTFIHTRAPAPQVRQRVRKMAISPQHSTSIATKTI